jgi:hypothetical protein
MQNETENSQDRLSAVEIAEHGPVRQKAGKNREKFPLPAGVALLIALAIIGLELWYSSTHAVRQGSQPVAEVTVSVMYAFY